MSRSQNPGISVEQLGHRPRSRPLRSTRNPRRSISVDAEDAMPPAKGHPHAPGSHFCLSPASSLFFLPSLS